MTTGTLDRTDTTPPEPSPFHLRTLVAEVLDSSGEADPGILAGLVLARIPEALVREALRQTLRQYVLKVNSECRGGSAPPAPFNGSAKVTGIRDGWQQRLSANIHVGESKWKKLRDCNFADLMAAAQERRDLAARNLAWADQYDLWAALLTEHDCGTFGDLPPAVQAAALGGQA